MKGVMRWGFFFSFIFRMGVGSYMRPLFPRVEQREHRLRAAAFRPQPTIYANLSGNWDAIGMAIGMAISLASCHTSLGHSSRPSKYGTSLDSEGCSTDAMQSPSLVSKHVQLRGYPICKGYKAGYSINHVCQEAPT